MIDVPDRASVSPVLTVATAVVPGIVIPLLARFTPARKEGVDGFVLETTVL